MTKPRTLEEIAKELARSEHWPDRKGEFALCGPCTERSHSLAGVPFPCDGYNEEVKRFLIALREAADTARHEEREALRHWISEYAKIATLGLPLLADLGEWLDARSRPAAPEAKESDCTCGEQWPCPLHGGPPAAPKLTPSKEVLSCHCTGDGHKPDCAFWMSLSEQPDLPLEHEFVAGHPHPAYQSYCALRGIFGLCGQPESAHRRKP